MTDAALPDDGTALLGTGVAAGLDGTLALPLKAGHPSDHAGIQLLVRIAGGTVVAADPRVGLMHRGAEKLFEARDYRQLMMLANRHDWLAPFSSELVIALAVEAATGIVPPERATWTRMLLAEAGRLTASLAFLVPVVEPAVALAASAWREALVAAQERGTGGRVHPMYARIGGVAMPLSGGTLDEYARLVAIGRELMPDIDDAVSSYAATLAGVAVLDRAAAIGFGASGPVGWASGVDLDVRRDEPYLAYAAVGEALAVPLHHDGDAAARYRALVGQLPGALAVMAACIDELRRLGDGPVDVPLPKTVRAPEGMTHAWLQAPLGITGVLLASVGDRTPWRLKVRTPSFASVQAMGHALVGTTGEQLADAVMSFFLVPGDIDR